ncbi:MAG: bacillithiol system redox-active protein YtxJ [Aestuariibaculum sp.]
MGLFGKKNNTDKNEGLKTPWITLDNMSQLETIVEKSKIRPQLIFKHSTRCGISRMVKKQFEAVYDIDENKANLHYLDLLANRDISNTIASKFEVFHESPQLLVVKNGVVVAHESHGSINNLDLKLFI